MSPNYLSPGVYVEEVDRGTKPIEAVGTAVAAFVGYTEKAIDDRDGEKYSLVGKPTLVTNWSQYVQKFGGFVEGIYTPDAVYGYFLNGGSVCYVVSIKTLGSSADPSLSTPAAATLPGPENRPAKLLEIKAREGGPSGNNIKVDIKHNPLPTDEEGKTPKDAKQTFNLVVSVGGQPTETFENLTIGGENDVATVVKQRSRLIEVEVTSAAKGDLVPAAGTYELAGGELKVKSITVKDYQGDVSQRSGLGGLE